MMESKDRWGKNSFKIGNHQNKKYSLAFLLILTLRDSFSLVYMIIYEILDIIELIILKWSEA